MKLTRAQQAFLFECHERGSINFVPAQAVMVRRLIRAGLVVPGKFVYQANVRKGIQCATATLTELGHDIAKKLLVGGRLAVTIALSRLVNDSLQK